MIAKVLGHFLVIFDVILGSQFVWKSRFFEVKKQHDFEHRFLTFWDVFWRFLEWIFEPLDIQKWAYGVGETPIFTFLAFPNHARETSRLRVMKKADLGLILDHFFEFVAPKTLPEIKSKKKWGKSWKKVVPRRPE